ncbi:MAG: porin [Bacteroidales bacterium]|nr:porin [Bacteroidales bacterium]
MKRYLFTLMLALAIPAGIFAQETATIDDDVQTDVNQYGQTVKVAPLSAQAQDGILVLKNDKIGYKIWFDNRVQVDGAAFFGAPDYADKIGNGVSIRRARFALKAQINKNWYGEIDMDMANGVFELKDAIIRYDGIRNMEIQAGNFKEFFAIQRNNSSRYLQFMERPMVAQALAPSRHIGVNAKYAKDWLWASSGVFFQTVDNLETRTFVEDANKDFGMNAGTSYTEKVVFMPGWNKQDWGLHLAGAFSYRNPKVDDEAASTSGTPSVRYSTRNTSSINRKKYIDTDEIGNVDHDLLYTAELAGYWKGFRGEAVYMADDNYQIGATDHSHLYGWYVQGGWLLFGGRQNYDTNGAKFTRVTRGRSWGDVELCARYEYIDFNGLLSGPAGGAEAYCLGLNYYVNNHVKFMVNYQFNNNDRYANGKGNKFYVGCDADGKPTKDFAKVANASGKAGVDYNMVSFRMEIDF